MIFNMKKVKSEPVKTVLIIAMGFIVVFLLTNWKWAIVVSLIVGVTGLSSLYLSKKIEFLWMKLTWVLSLIIPKILLAAIFFFILFPVSLLSKLFRKKDRLMLTGKLKSTYRVCTKSFDKKSFENPW